jgi:large subunit ribosomal protein L6
MMSRIAKNPITLPAGVSLTLGDREVAVKGSKGELKLVLHPHVQVEQEGTQINVKPIQDQKDHWMMAGTFRALLNNMVTGVSTGFQRKLELVGVGYRAQAKGDVLSLSLGFSHPVEYAVPAGISIQTPSQTEILVSGCDKGKVGQVAAEIRGYRPPEPYKGKGVRYANENVLRKEVKKK